MENDTTNQAQPNEEESTSTEGMVSSPTEESIPTDADEQQTLVPAEMHKRYQNYLIDYYVMIFILVFIGIALGFFFPHIKSFIGDKDSKDSPITWVIAIIYFVFYYTFFEAIWGKTPGKFFTKTIVLTQDGKKPAFIDILRRSLFRLIPFEIFSFLFSKNPTGWHDKFSSTIVLYKKDDQPSQKSRPTIFWLLVRDSVVSTIIYLLLLVLIFFAITTIVGFNKNKSQTNKSQTVGQEKTVAPVQQKTLNINPSETATWQTFRTKDFSFKYPTNAEVVNTSSFGVLNQEKTIYGFFIRPTINPSSTKWYEVDFFAIKNISQSTTGEYLKMLSNYDKTTLMKYKNGTIDGYSFVMEQPLVKNHPSVKPYLTVIEVKNHTLYVFQVAGDVFQTGGAKLTQDDQDMFHKIVSTISLPEKTTPDPKISELLMFKLPAGWTEQVTETDVSGYAGVLKLVSPDNAISITMKAAMDGKSQTFDKVYKAIFDSLTMESDTSNVTKTTIGGYPAFFSYDNKTNTYYYHVWNGDYHWYIQIHVPSLLEEQKHKSEIDSILSSIQFKE